VFACAAAVFALAAAGCGNTVSPQMVNALIPADCPDATGAKVAATDVVLLDWSGGVTKIYPNDDLPGLDLTAFETSDGGTLADNDDSFKEDVRAEVTRILCDMPTDGIHITNAKTGLPRDVSRVCFAQIASPLGGSQIGQGEYDPCNELHDNDAIIFGDELLKLGGSYSFDEWVQMFANVTAHEIGHTLGYPHVSRIIYPPSQRPAYVELMLATHTVDEMLDSQRYLSDVNNCPADQAVAKTIDVPVYTCGLHD
jgi:hypothetical protein